MNLKRALFNLYFYVAPKAATKWLNFKFDVAEALDSLDRDESGKLNNFDVAIILIGIILVGVGVLIAITAPVFPPG